MKRPVGVIDTGSNTVLGVIFRWDEEKNCYRNFDLSDGRVVHAKLIGYVQDGRLSESGIEALKEALREIRGFFAEKEPELMTVRCFATASLRGIVNFDAAAAAAAEVGYRIELLSGEEEAQCDFAGMLQEMEWMEAAAENGARLPSGGVAVDMGGGSGQLLCFTGREESGLAAFESFPIGCLKLTRRFIQKGEQPTDAELKAVGDFVRGEIERIPMIAALDEKDVKAAPAFFAMGGTVKAIVRLFRRMGRETTHPDFSGVDSLSLADLEESVRYFRSDAGRVLVEETEPGRKETLLAGIVTLATICRRVGAERMTVLQSGVREGYVLRHMD